MDEVDSPQPLSERCQGNDTCKCLSLVDLLDPVEESFDNAGGDHGCKSEWRWQPRRIVDDPDATGIGRFPHGVSVKARWSRGSRVARDELSGNLSKNDLEKGECEVQPRGCCD